MGSWTWPWRRREERKRVYEEAAGKIRQEAAVAFAEARQQRRSLAAALDQLMQTQAERAEEEHDVGFD